MALFEAINLEKTYYGDGDGLDTQVLKDITFTINKGEFVAVMGPSGSGKSTLLHILGFLVGSTGGIYKFNEKHYEDYSEEEVAHIRNKEMGFVFQSFNLLPRQTVRENVRLPLLYSNSPESVWDKKVKKVIKAVGLEHRADYETYKLSGGEKQRVAIARAIVNEPAVIFADEPTGNLDSVSGASVMNTIQELHEKFGHTVILITHETETARHAERIIHIKDGMVEKDEKVRARKKAKAFKK